MAKVVIQIEDLVDEQVSFKIESDPPVPVLEDGAYDAATAKYNSAQKILLDFMVFVQETYGRGAMTIPGEDTEFN